MKQKIIFSPFFCPSNVVSDSLPPAHYKETMSTILLWIQQSEAKLSMPQVAVAEYEIMEQRLRELKVSGQSVGMNDSNEKFRGTKGKAVMSLLNLTLQIMSEL